MTEDEIPTARGRVRLSRILALLLLVFVLLSSRLPGQTPAQPADQAKTGTLADLRSDKRVVQNGRWFLVREFTVDFAVRDSVTYCGEITTTDASEAHDLLDSGGQVVSVIEKGKDLYITLKSGRRIRAHRLSGDKCPSGHS
ncbi:MAG: hypothetical protein ACLPPV_04325 [Candidatus Korobacteraceae bacterium]|jgi:hypothetical protein